MDKVKNILVHLYRASQDLLFFIILQVKPSLFFYQ